VNIPVRAGLVLGVLVVIWQFVIGFTGWYKDPVMMNAFFLVIVFEIAVIIWALKKTCATAAYGRQVVNGLVVSVVAGVLIVAGSLVFTTIAFPDYFKELEAAQVAMLKTQGIPETEINAQVSAQAAMQTPLMNALSGFIGTVVTGLIVSAIAGAFLRKK
jgi:hypothetical protein